MAGYFPNKFIPIEETSSSARDGCRLANVGLGNLLVLALRASPISTSWKSTYPTKCLCR